jgi:putative endonuclease
MRNQWVANIVILLRRWYASLTEYLGGVLQRLPRKHQLSAGREGEDSAARHLARHGYRIVGRNFRTARGEIDLIATDRDTLVFVEVKARSDNHMGTPEAAVDQRKQERIRRAAEWYCARYKMLDRRIRFDVVAISGNGPARRIEVLKDAF